MTLLSVSRNSAYVEACKKKTLKSFEDVVQSYSYGENTDMQVQEVGVPTSSDGVILEIANVFQLNEQMLQTFRYVLEEVDNFKSSINFEDNTITYTIFFVDSKEQKKIGGYMSALQYVSHPLLYIGLLCLWNPQRYLFFL
jgi:hypothetical protein